MKKFFIKKLEDFVPTVKERIQELRTNNEKNEYWGEVGHFFEVDVDWNSSGDVKVEELFHKLLEALTLDQLVNILLFLESKGVEEKHSTLIKVITEIPSILDSLSDDRAALATLLIDVPTSDIKKILFNGLVSAVDLTEEQYKATRGTKKERAFKKNIDDLITNTSLLGMNAFGMQEQEQYLYLYGITLTAKTTNNFGSLLEYNHNYLPVLLASAKENKNEFTGALSSMIITNTFKYEIGSRNETYQAVNSLIN